MLLTVKDACSWVRVERHTLYQMIRSGELPAIRLGGRWRVREETLKRWARDQERIQRMPHAGA